MASSIALFWTKENSLSSLTMLFPLERPKSGWETQWSVLQKTVQGNQTAYPKRPQQVNPTKTQAAESSFLPTQQHPAIPAFSRGLRGTQLKVTISRPLPSAALALMPDFKKEPLQVTRKMYLYCHTVPQQRLPPLPIAHPPKLCSQREGKTATE